MISSLLDAVGFNLLEQGYKIGLDWLGKFAQVIIEGVGIIGLGIIVFTLVLKAITLPADIYQRVKMRKQTLIMRQMQPDLEKLQKQYANDKTMYNQKMMELYKKNGYSMMGACLPMILSLVILIVAFQGFRTYSQYANLSMYENMSSVYNAAVLENGVNGTDYRLSKDGVEDDEFTVSWEEDKTWSQDGVNYKMYYEVTTQKDENNNDRTVNRKYLSVISSDETKYMFYIYSLEDTKINREYKIDLDRLWNKMTEEERSALSESMQNGVSKEAACSDYVVKVGATAVRDWYRQENEKGQKNNDAHFLWIKNVWYPDVSYNHPIQDYAAFKKELNKDVTLVSGEKRALSSVLTETQYNNLTSELLEEKDQPNGYFILIILSIGFMVLSQFITMKSQKESNQYQTVDGQGAKTQKVMMIVMPLIYAVFAFMYSAAFSIYMTMSSLVSIIVTLISNLVLGRIFKKKEEQAIKDKYTHKLSWQQDTDKKGKKKKK